MLINTKRFYERIQLGLQHENEHVREMAEGCMSYLAFHLKDTQVVLPPPVVDMLVQLPEG